jgi:hypothetical protein
VEAGGVDVSYKILKNKMKNSTDINIPPEIPPIIKCDIQPFSQVDC